jgi:hypothetical protein
MIVRSVRSSSRLKAEMHSLQKNDLNLGRGLGDATAIVAVGLVDLSL